MPNYYGVFLNQTQNQAFKDNTVRQALRDSIDRADLITTVLNGQGTPVLSPIQSVSQDAGNTSIDDVNKKGPTETKWENIRNKISTNLPNWIVVFPIKKQP